MKRMPQKFNDFKAYANVCEVEIPNSYKEAVEREDVNH